MNAREAIRAICKDCVISEDAIETCDRIQCPLHKFRRRRARAAMVDVFRAIRRYCVVMCAGGYAYANACTQSDCPFHKFRMKGAPKRVIKEPEE